MSEGHFVTITVEWLPLFHSAKSSVLHIGNVEEQARILRRTVEYMIVENCLKIAEGVDDRRAIDVRFNDKVDHDNIDTTAYVTIRFDNRDDALLFKLTHGGAA